MNTFYWSLVLFISCMGICPYSLSAAETPDSSGAYQVYEAKFFLVPDEAIEALVAGTYSNNAKMIEALEISAVPLEPSQTLLSQQEQQFPEVWSEDSADIDLVADPLEPINRVFFYFNDKLYFWLLKPVATGYRKVIPQDIKICVSNFFYNLGMPIRAVNCLLQGKIEGFGNELLRFFVNSTAGGLGLGDPATQGLHLDKQDEDFGQTLGIFGLGPVIYINWPILGPSSLRDTIGLAGDMYTQPLNYLIDSTELNLALRGYGRVNETSLTIGDYESLKKAALDPYVALRDAYYQYRQNKIKH